MPDVRANDAPETAAPGKLIRPGWTKGPKNPMPRQACSAVEAFTVCEQLHGFAYELGLKPTAHPKQDVFDLGTLWHVGLAYRYAMRMDPRPDWLVYPTPQAPDPRHAIWTLGQDTPDVARQALELYDHYAAWYTTQQFQPVLVEHQLEAVFDIDGTSERYTLRIDLLAWDLFTRELVLVDHKSAYRIGKNTGDGYRTDREMLTGLALCRLNGYDVKRVVINAMQKPRDGANPIPLKFGRYNVPISPDAYNRVFADTQHTIRRMRQTKQAYPDARNRPRSYANCLRKYGECDFYRVCADGEQHLIQYTKKW